MRKCFAQRGTQAFLQLLRVFVKYSFHHFSTLIFVQPPPIIIMSNWHSCPRWHATRLYWQAASLLPQSFLFDGQTLPHYDGEFACDCYQIMMWVNYFLQSRKLRKERGGGSYADCRSGGVWVTSDFWGEGGFYSPCNKLLNRASKQWPEEQKCIASAILSVRQCLQEDKKKRNYNNGKNKLISLNQFLSTYPFFILRSLTPDPIHQLSILLPPLYLSLLVSGWFMAVLLL